VEWPGGAAEDERKPAYAPQTGGQHGEHYLGAMIDFLSMDSSIARATRAGIVGDLHRIGEGEG
jgi:hypothetical protein